MRRVDCPECKAEGLCGEYAYNTELASINGVAIHFWLGANASSELASKLLACMRNQRDIVGATYSDGAPVGFWAHENVEFAV